MKSFFPNRFIWYILLFGLCLLFVICFVILHYHVCSIDQFMQMPMQRKTIRITKSSLKHERISSRICLFSTFVNQRLHYLRWFFSFIPLFFISSNYYFSSFFTRAFNRFTKKLLFVRKLEQSIKKIQCGMKEDKIVTRWLNIKYPFMTLQSVNWAMNFHVNFSLNQLTTHCKWKWWLPAWTPNTEHWIFNKIVIMEWCSRKKIV